MHRSAPEHHPENAGAVQGPLECVWPVGIFVTDPAGLCLSVNDRWCEIAGLGAAEARGEGWARALHPEDRERVPDEWRRATREDRAFESRFRFQRPDGEATWVLGQALPERDAEGRITGFVGSVTDLTQQIRIEQELRESEERLQLTLDATAEGTWDWDIATGEIQISPHWLRLLGYAPGEIEPNASGLERLIHPEDSDRVRKHLAEHLSGRAPMYRCEHRLRTRSGGWRWNLHRGRVVERDADGNPLRMLGVDIDIGERKRAEEELARRAEQLRALALRLTLTEERERRRIASGLHDDVGQALALVRLKLEQLAETGSGDELAARADELRALLDRAIRGTRSLAFELSSPVLHELGLAAAVESLCEQLGQESGVKFRVLADSAPGALDADLRVLLFRSIRELCHNIVKHARASRAEVRIDSVDDRCRIVVRDDGAGCEAADLERASGPGGRLGLFAIRETSNQMGGSFEIESAPGKGTRASLDIPLG